MKGISLKGIHQSIGFKLMIIIIVGIIGCVAALGYSSYSIAGNIIRDEVSSATEGTIMQTGNKIDTLLATYENVAQMLTLDPVIRNSLENFVQPSLASVEKKRIQETVEQRLRNYINAADHILSIRLIPKTYEKADIFGDKSIEFDDQNKAVFEEVLANKGNPVWVSSSAKGFTRFNSEMTFTMTRLLINGANRDAEFFIVIDVQIAALEEALSNVTVGEGGDKLIIDESGQVVYSTNQELIETSVQNELNVTSRAEQSAEEANETTSGTYFTSISGTERLVAFAESQRSNWYVISHAKASSLTENTSKILNLTNILMIVSVFIAIGIGFLLLQMIAKPITNMKKSMERGKEGDLTVRIAVKRKDEIGQLAHSFNDMMDQMTNLIRQTNDSTAQVMHTANEVSNASKQTATAAQEINQAMESIAQGSSSLATEAEAGNERSNQMSNILDKVVDENIHLGTSAQEVHQVSQQGIQQMKALIDHTTSTESMMTSISGRVGELKDSTTSIRQILDLLNNMTKQTNILSLNASIEASRAGSAGKGFMVVADEIRKLAEQSKQNIEIVGEITEKIQNEVDETVKVMDEALPKFVQQKSSVQETDKIFNRVQHQMDDFILQLEKITEFINDLNKSQKVMSETMSNVSAFSEESSATTQQVASLSSTQEQMSEGLVRLADDLEHLSQSLQKALSNFKV
ncbi:methyl-accepting chemotaxis protein [Marinicrinis sediminis]|uniref:Methyl-accepting chemotaxis protein n=1 Tax=Marinicrinis sediminis TaxID=1652465 RepID=A0ABW5RDX0_9BACL